MESATELLQLNALLDSQQGNPLQLNEVNAWLEANPPTQEQRRKITALRRRQEELHKQVADLELSIGRYRLIKRFHRRQSEMIYLKYKFPT